jgi:thiamine transporter
MLCAIAVVLDTFVKIPIGQTGGSFNFSMVPIVIIAIRHGWFKGIIAGGIVYGVTTCIIDAYGFQFYPFSYLIGFGVFGLVGILGRFINKYYVYNNLVRNLVSIGIILVAVMLCGVLRWLSESINSVLFYGTTYGEGLIYNAIYILPSAALTAGVLAALLPTIKMINNRFPSNYLKD